MMNYYYWNGLYNNYGSWCQPWQTGGNFHFLGLLLLPFIAVFVIWSLVWKCLALWRAARVGSKGWFVALLIINTGGILEILYLYVFSKKNKKIEQK